MKKVEVLIKRMPGNLDLPLLCKMTGGAAGFDLVAAIQKETVISPGEYSLISTGIAVAIPLGYEGQIRPRSGLALKHGISLLNAPGTIDSDYRGEVKVILINLGKNPYLIKRGDRIAQLIIAATPDINLKETQELPKTLRADGGFGHTG